MWPTTWVDWCGIFGFVLSLSLAFHEFLKQRVLLRISMAEYYAVTLTQDVCTASIRAILENHSSLPIGISGFLFSAEGLHVNASLGEFVIAGSTIRKEKPKITHREEIVSTPLPIILNPYEASEIRLVFRFPIAETQSLSLPPWVYSPMERESNPPEFHRIKARLLTSRRSASVRFAVRVCAANSLMLELQHKNQIRT